MEPQLITLELSTTFPIHNLLWAMSTKPIQLGDMVLDRRDSVYATVDDVITITHGRETIFINKGISVEPVSANVLYRLVPLNPLNN